MGHFKTLAIKELNDKTQLNTKRKACQSDFKRRKTKIDFYGLLSGAILIAFIILTIIIWKS